MKFGTFAFNGKIYNLDYMKSDEIKKIIEKIEENKGINLRETESQSEK